MGKPWENGGLPSGKRFINYGTCILFGGKLTTHIYSLYKLVYKPHEYYSYLRATDHSEIGVIFINFAIKGGAHM